MLIRFLAALILGMLALVGCQPAASEPQAAPTLVDLNALATDSAATAAVLATPTRTPLPPTWTPPASATATETAVPATPTPEGFRAQGTIYYIFEGKSIIELAPDGTFTDLLPLPQDWDSVADLGISPDNWTLSFVAPGSGSGREVYLLDRRSLEYRQASALGYSSVRHPIWRPGGSEVTFIAGQAPQAAHDIYALAIDAQGQRLLLPMGSVGLRDMAWSDTGDILYVSNDGIFAFNEGEGQLAGPLTASLGFGPDYGMTHSPRDPFLYYLKPFRNIETGATGGLVYRIQTDSATDTLPQEQKMGEGFMERLAFDREGAFLLIASTTDVWVRDLAFNSSVQVVSGAKQLPQPIFSPDSQTVAYIDLDAAGVPQIFTVPRLGGPPRQLTSHTYGTVSDLVWAEN